MPDTFRLVTIGPDGRPRLVLDLNTFAGGLYRQRDSFSFTPAPRRERVLSGDARYQGNRVVDTAHDNATASVTLNVTGSGNPAVAATIVEALLDHADRIVGDGDLHLEWKPSGLAQAVYMPLRGPATVKPNMRSNAWAQSGFVPIEVAWPVAPLLEGLPMDVDERFVPPPDLAGGLVNYVPNPRGYIDAGGWTQSTTTGGTPGGVAPVVDGAEGAMLEGIYTAVTGNGSSIYLVPVTATHKHVESSDVRFGLRARAKVQALTGGLTVTSLQLQWRAYDHNKAYLSEGPVQTQATPVTGTVYDLAGTVDASALPAGTYYLDAAVRHVIGNLTGPGNITVRATRFALYTIAAGASVPAYGDGDDLTFRWDGPRHAARSVELVESKAAEYTNIGGDPVVITPDGLDYRGHVGNGAKQLAHTGRGYKVADAESIATGRYDGATALNFLSPGLAYDPVDGRCFAAFYGSGSTLKLYYFAAGAYNILATSGALAITVGKTYSVVCRKVGNRLEAELWAGEPVRGGTPLLATSFDLTELTFPRASDMGENRRGYGMPRIYYPDVGNGATIRRWRFLPYSITPRLGSPHPFLLRGIPGNAPAKAEVELSTGGLLAIPFALLGWRKYLRHDLIWNGDFPDLDGWGTAANINMATGATLARVASGGPNDAAYAQITSAATANTGAAFTGWGRLRAGRSYTVEFWANRVSGAWSSVVAGDNAASVSTIAALGGALGVWTRQQYTFTNAIDRDRFDLIFFHAAATAGDVLRVAGVRMWEGQTADAPPPEAFAQRDGRGAYAPFGIIHAMGDDPSSRVGFTQQAVAGSIAGQRMRLTAPTLAGSLEYPIDPTLLDLGDDATRGDVDVEVYAMGALAATLKTPRVALSVRSGDVTVVPSYTREDGSIGKALVLPSAGTVDRAFRLGTITLPRDPDLVGAARLRLDATLGAASTGYLEAEYLILVPRRSRVGSPTGLVNDASYPTFLPAQAAAASKTVRADGSAVITRGQVSARSTGLAGAELELPPGDVELLAWMQEAAVPDDPSSNALVANDANVNVHVGVTPRYRLMRDA